LLTQRENGLNLRSARLTRAAIGLALLFLGIVGAHRASAQITFGSPGDPPRVALGGGAFNFLGNKGKPDSAITGMELAEYRFGDVWWIISPFVGVFGTGQAAFYGYFGISFDIHFPDNMILTPSAAAGYFNRGHGIDLDFWWEFRTGAELAYRFADGRRLGISFYHISNAGLGTHDPGEEQLEGVLTVPFR
jgi:lipid A 3-O-deacylase